MSIKQIILAFCKGVIIAILLMYFDISIIQDAFKWWVGCISLNAIANFHIQ